MINSIKLRTDTKLRKAILGTLVGDSIGLPMENLSPRKIEKLGWTTPLQHRFVFGRGMWSDDTDHTLMLVEAALLSEGDVVLFKKQFSRRLRFWLSTLPPGVGLATLRSIIKQAIGIPLDKTGIFSAGNGPRMRAAVLGVIFAYDPHKRDLYNIAQTELTHSDPKALHASTLIVEIAALFSNDRTSIESTLNKCGTTNKEWQGLLESASRSANDNFPRCEALKSLAIDPRKGGDTDSTAAIAGALCSLHPSNTIPCEWKDSLCEFPTSVAKIETVCEQIEQGHIARFYNKWFWPLYLFRNIFQLLVIIAHVLVRCLPASVAKNLFIRQ